MGKKIIGCIRNALAACVKSLTPHYMEHYTEFTILQGCPNTQIATQTSNGAADFKCSTVTGNDQPE